MHRPSTNNGAGYLIKTSDPFLRIQTKSMNQAVDGKRVCPIWIAFCWKHSFRFYFRHRIYQQTKGQRLSFKCIILGNEAFEAKLFCIDVRRPVCDVDFSPALHLYVWLMPWVNLGSYRWLVSGLRSNSRLTGFSGRVKETGQISLSLFLCQSERVSSDSVRGSFKDRAASCQAATKRDKTRADVCFV